MRSLSLTRSLRLICQCFFFFWILPIRFMSVDWPLYIYIYSPFTNLFLCCNYQGEAYSEENSKLVDFLCKPSEGPCWYAAVFGFLRERIQFWKPEVCGLAYKNLVIKTAFTPRCRHKKITAEMPFRVTLSHSFDPVLCQLRKGVLRLFSATF